MLVLSLNCGSSTLKFALYEVEAGEFAQRAGGSVERINDRPALISWLGDAPSGEAAVDSPGYAAATSAILNWLGANLGGRPIDLIGHRVVHGGPHYRDAAVIDANVLRAIEDAGQFARLHNAPALAVVHAVTARTGSDTTQVAVFDTAFHREMPLHASRYAIPWELAERHGFERYGFHGIAHRYMVQTVAAAHPARSEDLRLITLQLGSGCSAAAIRGERSIDTSMGLTPLEGLMMGTRSGDVDPALPALLADAESVSLDEVQGWLNERSGLLGVSGRSADVRDLLEAERTGDERSSHALDMFCYRVRKQIGSYLAALGGADAVVFGGGIGEHQPAIRRRILQPLGGLGFTLDDARNAEARGPLSLITADSAAIAAYVVAVDEQRAIAGAAVKCARVRDDLD